MRQAAKRARQAGRWVESEIRRSIKGFGERPSMPYRLEHPGHDDIVYSRPPPPTAEPVSPEPDEQPRPSQRGRTLQGVGHPTSEDDGAPSETASRVRRRS
jgi:hypothetical protein